MIPRLQDERGFVVASLLRLVFILILFGLVAVEGGSIIYTRIALDNAVNAAAVAGADQFDTNRNVQIAEEEARRALAERDEEAKLTRFEVLPDGAARVTARKEAPTILVQRLDFLKKLGVVEVVGEGRPGGLI